MALLKTSILLFSVIIMSYCSSTKTSNTSEKSTHKETESTKMTEAGFKKGVIVVSTKEGDCPITIEIQEGDSSYFLDPINISEKYNAVDGEKIWFKFNGLRMMNRCEKANPVSISEIQKRVE